MKKILVTGATGFIGTYVIEELLRLKYDVIATSSSLAKAKLMPWYDRVTYIAFDFGSYNEGTDYFDCFHKPAALIHLAWEGLPNYTSDFHVTKNLPAQLGFLSNLLRNGLKDITVTGTCFEYGMQEGKLEESMPVLPANPYAVAKDELRKKLELLCMRAGASLKWIRLFYMYGPGQNARSLIAQLDNALDNNEETFNMSGGEQERDFLPVTKVAEYLVRIATQDNVTGIINCCSGQPVKVKDFVLEYLAKKNKTIQLNLGYYPYASYEPMRFWGDNAKLQKILQA
jgi:dTDP-6-deoxy-L-talose 4-dehydrogenase (NAD+)